MYRTMLRAPASNAVAKRRVCIFSEGKNPKSQIWGPRGETCFYTFTIDVVESRVGAFSVLECVVLALP